MALVVTIVILIILAGVTINMLLGSDGIIARAKYAKESYENATNEEQDQIANAEAILANNLINEVSDNIENNNKEEEKIIIPTDKINLFDSNNVLVKF